MSKVVKVLFGLPWYQGPDIETYPLYFEHMHYYGRLRERSLWLNWVGKKWGSEVQNEALKEITPLDPKQADTNYAEIWHDQHDVVFEFGLADETRLSLPGLARERLAETAMREGYDYLFMWDYDMKFSWSMFMRLFRHQKSVVSALAFTARPPYDPVIYRIKQYQDPTHGIRHESETVHNYPKNQLVSGADVGGALAFGGAVNLIHTSVFRKIPKPWFHSTGCGEDFMFCLRCHLHDIPVYVDTAAQTLHKQHASNWIGETHYEQNRHSPNDSDTNMEQPAPA